MRFDLSGRRDDVFKRLAADKAVDVSSNIARATLNGVRSVAILGASGGAAFGALVPALTAFLAIPLLGEWPSDTGWVAIVLISAGVYLTSGGPLPRTQRSLAPLTISQSTNSRIIGDRLAWRGRKTK